MENETTLDVSEKSTLTDSVLVELYGEREVRWYQIASRTEVEIFLEQGFKRILVQLPTGAGKTLTSGLIFSSERIRNALGVHGRNLKVLFIAHMHRLLSQAEKEFANAENIDFIPWSAFSSLPDNLEWDICCIDEAHHEACNTIQYQLDKIGDKPIIGLTANSERPDGLLIKFEKIVNPISREQAVREGWLADSEINTILDTPEKNKVPVIKQLIESYGKHMGQTMVFVRTKKEVAALISWMEANTEYSVVGILNQDGKELDKILDDFSTGKVQFIINCNRIGEGVDVKGCTDVILGRQFGSYLQLNQVIGRTSRPDSKSVVWEFINPISATNLDSTVIVGTPKVHRLLFKRKGQWFSRKFDYTR